MFLTPSNNTNPDNTCNNYEILCQESLPKSPHVLMNQNFTKDSPYLLTPFHKYFLYREQCKLFSSTVYVGAQVNSSYSIDLNLLKMAVKNMLKKNSNKQLLLQVNLENLMQNETHKLEPNKSEITLLKITELAYDNFVYIYDDSNLDSIGDPSFVNDVLKQKIDVGIENVPLWRLLYLPKLNYVVFNYSHILYDGLSGTVFIDLLFEELDVLKSGSVMFENMNTFSRELFEKGVEIKGDSRLLDFNIVDIFPRISKMSFCFLSYITILLYSLLASSLKFEFLNFIKRHEKLKFKSRADIKAGIFVQYSAYYVVKGSDMKILLSICKKHGITFNSLLLSVLSLSSPEIDMAAESTSKKEKVYENTISIPLNARKLIFKEEALQKLIGLLVTSGKISTGRINIKNSVDNILITVINLARRINSKVKQKCIGEFQKTVNEIGLLNAAIGDKIKNLDVVIEENPKQKYDYEVSNLGCCNQKSNHAIERLVFNQSFNPRSTNMTISCITGGSSGDCTLSFMTTNEPELSNWCQRFDTLLLEVLNGLDAK